MTVLPLSKTLDPGDLDHALIPALKYVDAVPLGDQHPMRRWEYALAVEALRVWRRGRFITTRTLHGLDVGGAGSPFAQMLTAAGCPTEIVDPKINTDLATYVQQDHSSFAIVCCLSVLEHVACPTEFLAHLTTCVAPGGLLVLTFDYHPTMTEDEGHFHWMRRFIVNQTSWRFVERYLEGLGMRRFGEADYTCHGLYVYNYTFASLVMQKKASA